MVHMIGIYIDGRIEEIQGKHYATFLSAHEWVIGLVFT
jgi:hypothetical protein